MDREERRRAKAVVKDVKDWVDRLAKVLDERQRIMTAAADATAEISARFTPIPTGKKPSWRTVGLMPSDGEILAACARAHALPKLSSSMQRAVKRVTSDETLKFLADAKAAVGARRMFAGRDQKEAGVLATNSLTQLHGELSREDLTMELGALESRTKSSKKYPPETVLDDAAGLRRLFGVAPELLTQTDLDSAYRYIRTIDRALDQEHEFRSAVTTAANAVRQTEARSMVADIPVERLKDATSGQVRINALTAAGIGTVLEVLEREFLIESLPGVGETTGRRMIGAARTIWQTTLDEMPVRIDIKNRTQATAELLSAMRSWEAARSIQTATDDLAAANDIRLLLNSLDPKTTHVVVKADSRPAPDLRAAIDAIARRAALIAGEKGPSTKDPWDDFLARPADYYAMLSELGFLPDDDKASEGDLPEEILDAIRDLKLEMSHLDASLRGYQSFAARFAVVQRKVIIGDEMGLGKTVESLAVLTHLRAKGAHHFLVVCPAAVVTNWMREVTDKSKLRAHRLHGPGRDGALTAWIRGGGVAITTYDSLTWLDGQIPDRAQPACVVFDEAHYIKNPDAKRTRRSRALIEQADRAILLTGTPLENRIEEFRNLVGYLRPDLTVNASEFAPRQFRKQVAPAYLRRNQEDVLTELPDLVEVDEWMPLSSSDYEHYRAAVVEGNFMGMRQAAMRAGAKSQKMQRLFEIVEEAEDNERKVLVFSHFRDALDDIASILPGKVFGPLTGSVPAAKRQQMVDEFSVASHGAVLVAQIVAGGVGLNIQAASVVVIVEPQLKPTTEWQAIARSRRMGQLESVQVHRLLSEDGVDRRITQILARKSELFADFARVSETADSAPEAFDISDAEIAREVVAAERERLLATTTS
ncbi:ATP-dependent helicase [Aeromicrobium sp. 636]|uniref:DEAD/DEAH box helicase n=1 Tax=Aeromicrobium senzhongii TaxID=2663859 RepID=A0A8I0JZF6_9ACTN|nr:MULTISPECIES: DEAD/DEAH box helicase [Aeromicrobium]MBC9225937.1 DEAD/DEAH box helicase [Aeromicrobium senzhongii]MCQ3998044.1 ATP-dependent helicase [Aeromicrobium sp. 636]